MANNDYLNDYLQFFQYFDDTFDPSDQLPVKLASYKLFKKEVVGAIFNWTNQYLGEKKCPYHLISFLSRIVIEKTRKRCKKQPIQCGFNPSDNAYEPLKLMHTVIEVINEVCFNYKLSLNVQNTKQNMAVSNPLPPPEAVYNVVSVSALKNSRRKMEDRHIVIHDLNTIFTKQDATPSHYYAVFDGHDGEDAAAYSANHLHQFLAESTNFTTEPEQALRDAFCRTDSMFLNKCESENIVGGTTAVCALLLPKEKTLYIAWTGDSQAALVSKGKIMQCVKPHKPDREDERMRIEKEGGIVLHWGVWRVNGQLGVSRAIGDSQYKPYVTAVPEIVKIPLGPEDDFFILGSDGLWDHVSETDIARVVYDVTYSNPDKADLVSRDLVQLAKCNGSSDNISVIVVFLRHPRNIAAGPRWTNIVVGMEALDNANPFVVAKKANGEGLNDHDDEGLLLNINDGFEVLKKKDEMPNNDLIKMLEKSNCARLTPEFDKDDNLGPETDVDNPDDGSASPNLDAMTRRTEAINNNQHFNPFNDIEKSLELNLNLKEGTFEEVTTPIEETGPPPTNSVHNVSQLIDAGADSDSEEEEEWNYVSGQEANKESVVPLQLNSKVAEEEEEDDTEETMSQLNPNAAEFVPVSPTRAIASPIGRLLCDEVLSQSPKRPPTNEELDLNVPSPVDFENEISKKPHEIEEGISNGHQVDVDIEDKENVSNLNNKLEEFHFGPNAAPFTPIKLLDQSEASSTRAVYGDESVITLGTSFNDSQFGQDDLDRAELLTAKDDPMSVSFHQDRDDDTNPFDLNKVHMLPDDEDDELVERCDLSNSLLNDTISDLAEHFPLSKPEEEIKPSLGFPVTDLDHEDNKNFYDNRVTSPLKSDRSESPLEDSRTESPSENDRVSIPFEEDRAVSPIQEQKISSHFEDREMFSPTVGKDEYPEDERELCSPLRENDSNILIGEKEGISHEDEKVCSVDKDKEILFPEQERDIHSPLQYEEVSSAMEETETRHILEDNKEKYMVEEKEVSSLSEGVKEKCTIEEKEVSSPLEEEHDEFMIEEKEVSSPFEQIKEKLMVEEKEVSSPLEDEVAISPVDEKSVVSLIEEKNVDSFVEENVVSQVKENVVPPVEESVVFPVEENVVSPVEENVAFPVEENVVCPVEEHVVSSVEEKVVTFPVEQKDGDFQVEEKYVESPAEERAVASPVEEIVGTCVIQEKQMGFPNEQMSDIFPLEQKSEILVQEKSEVLSEQQESEFSQVEDPQISSHSEEKGSSCSLGDQLSPCLPSEKETAHPLEVREIDQLEEQLRDEVKAVESVLEVIEVEENRVVTPVVDQIISAVQIKEDLSSSAVEDSKSVEPCLGPFEVSTTSCDNVERPQSVNSEASPDSEEFTGRHNENTGFESTTEKVDYLSNLGVINTVTSTEEPRDVFVATANNELPDTSTPSNIPADVDLLGDVRPLKTPEPIAVEELQPLTAESVKQAEEKEAPSRPPNDLPLLSTTFSDEDDPLHSHPTPECDQLLADQRDPLNVSAAGSFVDTESVATTEVNSFLGRSLLQEVASPLSPNMSNQSESIVREPIGDVCSAPVIDLTADDSPAREMPKDFSGLTSTPAAARPLSLSPLAPQVLSDSGAKSSSKLTPKESEKKVPAKGKTTPSLAAAKKAPTPRSSLGPTSKATGPSPRLSLSSPRAAAPSRTSKPIPSKTDTGAAAKAPSKPAPAPKTTTARVPLSSRTLTKPAATNGDSKTTPKTSTGAIKKSTEGSGSTRSTASTVGSRTATGTTSRAPLNSAKSTTTAASANRNTTTAAPKPRPNTLKPAVSKTATTLKSTSAAKPAATTTHKAPASTKPSATSLSHRAPISRSTQPKPAQATTEKQIKETANKLTASRTSTATRTSATRKSEEKVSSTKTSSNRTTSTTTTTTAAAAPAYRPPIRRPPATADAKAAATKIGKPKQNGVAAVVTEQIIVNTDQQRGAEMNNGLSNGDGRFVKDNSPVDNKLIVESNMTTETAAN